MCQNIDDFNRGCALVFARLYASFPRPVVLAAGYLGFESKRRGPK
jgi:hypothetical protein